ncbi:helix-turn-helix transcriptional regulator [Brachybacterium huguangmaarense]|uniref:Helix-turn-helix transcriptional regulator n=1 Tax=Brachybacterium huguangmaarense TaxID=1652028 RepID=A0ABY6G0K7_9MICO|nr:helix-turn-helix transcriptional regulator [Brachybacterium huguangmaarense]UYG16731.1 helix-turn-helix transcriptional regulator [Brachybacterium huguangmaarense]
MTPTQGFDEHAPVFVISVAAELSGMHPQTLRQYDRLGLVTPSRSAGRGRRYSARDVAKLRQVQRLSQEEGINLAGIKRILELEDQVRAMHEQLGAVQRAVEQQLSPASARRVFAADSDGQVTSLSRGQRPERQQAGALVLWRPRRS